MGTKVVSKRTKKKGGIKKIGVLEGVHHGVVVRGDRKAGREREKGS
jgi:hypothetical protein